MNMMNWLAVAAAETAGTAGTAGTAEAAAEQMSGGATFVYYLVQLAPMVLIFVVFYFILIRPQRKKDKEAKEMLNSLKVGDRVCTIGGIYATVVAIKDDVLTVEVGNQKTQMMIARWAVRNVEAVSVTNDAETLI